MFIDMQAEKQTNERRYNKMRLTHWELLEHARMAESLKLQRENKMLKAVAVLLALSVLVLAIGVTIEVWP